ncbi:MAG: hypothetical protein QXI71_02455 [Candidatus Bathyarchaeia archaeon]
MSSVTLRGGFVVTSDKISKLNIVIENEHISEIGKNTEKGEVIDCNGLYILPGFRDQHVHDLIGSTSEPDPDRLSKISISLAMNGVTSAKIATTAMPFDRLERYLRSIRDYITSERNGKEGARIEGVHLEGTFIRKDCSGAQPVEYVVEPRDTSAKNTLDLLNATGAIKLINIVPDFGSDLIEYAASKNLIVGCGHSRASANQLRDACRKGLKYIVHITNGPMGQSFKPFDGGGTYEGALTLPLFIEMIPDGYHIDMRYVSDIAERRIGQGRKHELIAITDSVFPVKNEIPQGEFEYFSVVGSANEEKSIVLVKRYKDVDGLWKKPNFTTLFGSVLSMDKAFENLLNLFSSDVLGYMIDRPARSFEEALQLASAMTSTNQAMLEGLTDVGVLKEGNKADITILSISGKGGSFRVKVMGTIVSGKLFKIGA